MVCNSKSYRYVQDKLGVRGGTALHVGRSRVRFPMGSFRPLCDPGVDSASNSIEYQGYFLGYKRPVPSADNLADYLQILGASTSWSPKGLPGPIEG
jgi:hypothetical protein